MAETGSRSELRSTLTAPMIVFIVVAAAAPLASMVGNLPVGLAFGNGAGVPAAFLLVTLVLLCFAVGYARMSRRVVNTGGFYTYVGLGLGRPAGIAGAFIAVLAYCTQTFGLVGAFGYFAALVLKGFGLDLPWEVYGALAVATVAVLGYRQIDLSAMVLAVLLLAEVGLLLLFDGAVLASEGFGALPTESFFPGVVFAGAPGIALGFVFQSFIGFEAAALYGEEARNPRRSVPLAIYSSVLLIGVFYCLTAWIAVGAVGAGRARAVAAEQLGGFTLALNTEYAGELATSAMSLVVVTSIFATYLALHNAASRYLFALGRETVLPAPLGVAHPRRGSPHVASLTLTCATAIVASAFAFAGLDPYIGFATTMLGMGTLGIMLLLVLAALAIIAYFRRRRDGENPWKTLVAPLIGFVGLTVTTVLFVANYSLITGTESPFVNALPLLYAPAVVGGLVYAFWLRRSRPERYARVAVASAREEDR